MEHNLRTVKMPPDKIQSTLDKHFSKTYPDGFHGYRGAKYTENSLFINPQKLTRTSKDTNNLYYVLMDNLPSYKNYPSITYLVQYITLASTRYARKKYSLKYTSIIHTLQKIDAHTSLLKKITISHIFYKCIYLSNSASHFYTNQSTHCQNHTKIHWVSS